MVKVNDPKKKQVKHPIYTRYKNNKALRNTFSQEKDMNRRAECLCLPSPPHVTTLSARSAQAERKK
jgi:hypothetical protein